MMKMLLRCALAAAVIAAAAPSIAAARPGDPQRGPGHGPDHGAQAPVKKPAPNAHNGQHNAYGQWNKAWGAKPPAAPKHWTKKGDWYRHVRVCQQKYRSYNARTDTYRTSAGKPRRCTL